MSKQE
jgi:hypothetical protein